MKKLLSISLIILFIINSYVTAQWVKTNGPCGSSGAVYAIAVSSSAIFAASYGNVFRSTDKGNSWSLVYSNNLMQFNISSIAFSNSYVYAGTSNPICFDLFRQ